MIHTSHIGLKCLADAQLGGVRLCRAQVGGRSLLRGRTALRLLSRGCLQAAYNLCLRSCCRQVGCQIGLWSRYLVMPRFSWLQAGLYMARETIRSVSICRPGLPVQSCATTCCRWPQRAAAHTAYHASRCLQLATAHLELGLSLLQLLALHLQLPLQRDHQVAQVEAGHLQHAKVTPTGRCPLETLTPEMDLCRLNQAGGSRA